MSNIVFTLDIVAPVFLTILLGVLLRRGGMLTDDFIRRSSKIVFYVALPAMIVVEMSSMNFKTTIFPLAAAILIMVTLTAYTLTWIISGMLTREGHTRGAFIQGCYRGNIAIVALPILAGMMGDTALATGVFLLAVTLPLYNILAVIALSVPAQEGRRISRRAISREILTNPLIIAVGAGVLLALLPFTLPSFIMRTANHLGKMTFPLALLGIGAGINMSSIRRRMALTLWASAVKTLLLPLCCVTLGWLLGLEQSMLAILFVVAGAPTAVSSFIMVKAMNGDADLAGGIVTASTILSALTLSAAILAFRSLGML